MGCVCLSVNQGVGNRNRGTVDIETCNLTDRLRSEIKNHTMSHNNVTLVFWLYFVTC